MTASVFERALLVGVLAGAACAPAESQGATAEQLVESFLDSVKHAAPVRGDMSATREDCSATPWQTLHPEHPDRRWTPTSAVAWSTVTAAIELAPVTLETILIGPLEIVEALIGPEVDDDIVLVQPWDGEATIECGGVRTDSATYVIVAVAPTERFDDAGMDLAERFDSMSANVNEAGLEAADDMTLSMSTCDDTESPCDPGMPPLDE